jgi:hypothetical protein
VLREQEHDGSGAVDGRLGLVDADACASRVHEHELHVALPARAQRAARRVDDLAGAHAHRPEAGQQINFR